MQDTEVAYERGYAAGVAQEGVQSCPYAILFLRNEWYKGYNHGAASLIQHEEPKIGYVALKSIKYKLHETFDVIKANPMDLNLLMEHIARLTSSVAILSEYLAGNEADHDMTG